MERQDLTVHHDRPLELARSCAGLYWAQWQGQAFSQVMKACDECARQHDEDGTGKPRAVGEAVAGASVSEQCPSPAAVQPPLPRDTRHSCWRPCLVGVKGTTGMSLAIVCGTLGLAPPQTDVFGPCFSGLSWKTAPGLGSARLSKLCCQRGQVLWKSNDSTRVLTEAFILDNCSETWMNHVISVKHWIMHPPNLPATKFIRKKSVHLFKVLAAFYQDKCLDLITIWASQSIYLIAQLPSYLICLEPDLKNHLNVRDDNNSTCTKTLGKTVSLKCNSLQTGVGCLYFPRNIRFSVDMEYSCNLSTAITI